MCTIISPVTAGNTSLRTVRPLNCGQRTDAASVMSTSPVYQRSAKRQGYLRFSSADASGSTSQAAAVIEGIEAGAAAFLIDEDTSATNFMLRDELMQKIVSRDKEPITPFIERARDLYEKAGISTVLVAGSSGAYFYIADTVIQMDSYRPLDITEQVKKACEAYREISSPALTAPGFLFPSQEAARPAQAPTADGEVQIPATDGATKTGRPD